MNINSHVRLTEDIDLRETHNLSKVTSTLYTGEVGLIVGQEGPYWVVLFDQIRVLVLEESLQEVRAVTRWEPV